MANEPARNSDKLWWAVGVVVIGTFLSDVVHRWIWPAAEPAGELTTQSDSPLYQLGHAFAGSFHALGSGIIWLFTAWYSLPVIAILVLGLLSLYAIANIWHEWYQTTEQYKSSHERYTEDVIYGVFWTWNYQLGAITNLEPHCPKDKTPMAGLYDWNNANQEINWYKCETCGHQSTQLPGGGNAYFQAVKRQIAGKINRKEYLQIIKAQKGP